MKLSLERWNWFTIFGKRVLSFLPLREKVIEVFVFGGAGIFIGIAVLSVKEHESRVLEKLTAVQQEILKSTNLKVSADMTTALFPYMACDAKQELRESAALLVKKHSPQFFEDVIVMLKGCRFVDPKTLEWLSLMEADSKGLANQVEFIRLVNAGRQYYDDGHFERAAVIWSQAQNILPEDYIKLNDTFPNGLINAGKLAQASEALSRKEILLAADLFRIAYANIRAQ